MTFQVIARKCGDLGGFEVACDVEAAAVIHRAVRDEHAAILEQVFEEWLAWRLGSVAPAVSERVVERGEAQQIAAFLGAGWAGQDDGEGDLLAGAVRRTAADIVAVAVGAEGDRGGAVGDLAVRIVDDGVPAGRDLGAVDLDALAGLVCAQLVPDVVGGQVSGDVGCEFVGLVVAGRGFGQDDLRVVAGVEAGGGVPGEQRFGDGAGVGDGVVGGRTCARPGAVLGSPGWGRWAWSGAAPPADLAGWCRGRCRAG